MNEAIVYLAKASVGMALFYLVFWLTLRKETTFKVNRAFLVTSLLISIILPLIPITYKANIQINTLSFTEIEKGLKPIISNNPIPSESTGINWLKLIPITYLLGVTIFFTRLLWQSTSLMLLVYKNKARRINNMLILENHKYELPFSFLNIVFINPSIHKGTDLTNILAHEKVHIREQHWLDLLVIELITTIFWFNPFVWLYERSIKQNHEYLADEGVLAQGFSIGQYQAILINQIMGMQVIGLTNNLNYSLNKKRMTMMTKAKTPKNRVYKILWALPATALMILAFAKPAYVMDSKPNQTKESIQDKGLPKIKVQAKVINDEGLTIKGASVMIYNKYEGTITDDNGAFSLEITKADLIIISYVGYTSLSKNYHDFEMKEKDNQPTFKLIRGTIKLDADKILQEGEPKQDISSATTSNKTDNEVYVAVESLPEYPGGNYALAKEIKDKISKLKIAGKIDIGFTVDENGYSKLFQIGGVTENTSKEIFLIIKNLKQWNPGKQRGTGVPVNYNISFNL